MDLIQVVAPLLATIVSLALFIYVVKLIIGELQTNSVRWGFVLLYAGFAGGLLFVSSLMFAWANLNSGGAIAKIFDFSSDSSSDSSGSSSDSSDSQKDS